MNEVELHPYLAQPKLVAFCQEAGVHVVAYSPLGKVGYRNPGDPSLFEDPVVQAWAVLCLRGRCPARSGPGKTLTPTLARTQ